MQYGFVKVACATPQVRVADCAANARQTIQAILAAHAQGVEVLCLPERGLPVTPVKICFCSRCSSRERCRH